MQLVTWIRVVQAGFGAGVVNRKSAALAKEQNRLKVLHIPAVGRGVVLLPHQQPVKAESGGGKVIQRGLQIQVVYHQIAMGRVFQHRKKERGIVSRGDVVMDKQLAVVAGKDARRLGRVRLTTATDASIGRIGGDKVNRGQGWAGCPGNRRDRWLCCGWCSNLWC